MAKTQAKREKRRMSMGDRTKKAAEASLFSSTTFKPPKGMELFEPKIGQSYVINIVPFITGDGNPNCPEKGELWWERTYWVHKGVGARKQWAVCLARTAGKRCPICDYIDKLKRDATTDKKLIAALQPKKRQLFNVMLADEDKIRLWEMSYHLFGKRLNADILNSDEEDAIRDFAELDGGSSLKINVTEGTTDTSKFPEVSSILYRQRKKALSEELPEKTACLDDILIVLDYKQLEKMFFETIDDDGESDDDDGFTAAGDDDTDEAPPKKSKKAKSDDEDDDWDDAEDDEPAPKKSKKAKAKTKAPVEDEEEEDDDVEEDDEPAPKKSKAKPKAKAPVEEEDGDDDWDDDAEEDENDDIEDEPAPKKSKAKPKAKAKAPVEDEDDADDWDEDDVEDEDEEDDEPAPKKAKPKAKATKPKAKSKTKAPVEDEEDGDDWDDDD